jgi:hypothetical protein
MSENLHAPLFLLSIFLLMNTAREAKKMDLIMNTLFGVSMALAYLTKYIYLAAIPFLIFLWFLKPLFREDIAKRKIFEKKRLFEFLTVLGGFVLTYTPWLVYVHYSGFPLTMGMGLKFISSGIGDFATLKGLFVWTGFYLSYFILVLAPYLLVFSIYFLMLLSGYIRNNRQETFFIFTVLLLSCIFLLTAIQHSWRAPYNYPVPQRIMGRYLMHLVPLYIIVFMISLNKIITAEYRLRLSYIIYCTLACIIAISTALGVLFITPAANGLIFTFENSPDVVIYGSRIFTFFVLLLLILQASILAFGRWNMYLTKRFILTFSVFVLIIQLSSSYKAFEQTIYIRPPYQLHGRPLAEFLKKEIKTDNKKITLVYDNLEMPVEWLLTFSIKFWLPQSLSDISINYIHISNYYSDENILSGKIFMLAKKNFGSPLFSYVIGKQSYHLYDIQSILHNKT